MMARRLKQTVYVEDIPVDVHYYIYPAEPDVGIDSPYCEVDEIDLSDVEYWIKSQFEGGLYEEEGA